MKSNDEPDVLDLPTAIAVVGMSCRLPGARNLVEFRQNLENGVESIKTFSDDELLAAGVDRKLLSNPNYVKAAPLLEDFDQFDAAFFEFSPREAAIMDPQQRLFLECAWEALEDAAHAGDASGSRTGVFAGGGGVMSTYLLSDTHFNPQLTGTTASMQHVGNDKDYLSSRVSYKFNLRGPSFAVLSACSTSLVAVHLACQSLLTGECDMALAGGTSVRVPQRTGYLYKDGNVFSQDGHCRPFDADATGTVFGSGIGVVVLKRLKDAIRDRDAIRAVIRGTAINNDGAENKISYWAPHAEGQADAMRRALSAARVEPSTIGYVEAHGTATRKGDPTEIRALAQAFGEMPPGSCAIGSVKSNIGHPESAAGVAGLIKAVLSLESRTLFPTLHYSRPNPEVDFDHGFYVNASATPWVAGATPRRAGVNALGIGGTNAFAILEEAPERRVVPPNVERPYQVLTLSAKTPEALDALALRFSEYLGTNPDQSFADICYSANVGRAHFAHRRALVATSAAEAAELAASTASAGHIESGHVTANRRPRIAFLFTGQGSQYVGMARELYETENTFREVFDRCAKTLSSYLDQPLVNALYPASGESPLINETSYTQPALFATEYALAALWRSWGVEPSVLLGHSVGEIVAACVAGVIGLDDALRLTAERARLMQALPRGGGMAAVRCEPARVERAIAAYPDTVSIAAINGPADVVISGRIEDVGTVVAGFEREGVAATRLKVSHAFHSPLMDPMLAEFGRVAASITYAPPRIPLISNLTTQSATADTYTPEYWVRHVRESVRFADGIRAAHEQGVDIFLEIGPSPVLLGMARQSVPQGAEAWLPSLRPGRSDWRQMTESLAALYVRGAGVDWSAFDRHFSRTRVHLPTYAFQRQRYWIEAAPAAAQPVVGQSGALLGQRLRLPHSKEIRFETRWSPHAPPYLDDHRIFDTVVVPGASHIAMALTAMKEVSGQGACVLEDVVFPQALTLDEDGVRTAQLIVTRDEGREGSFEVISLREGQDENQPASWVVHATGRIGQDAVQAAPVQLEQWRARCPRRTSNADFYDKFWAAGYHLRGAFRWIRNTWGGDGEILCELAWPELPDDPAEYPLYPSLIDACFQAVFSDKASELLTDDAVYVPFSVRRFGFHGSPRPVTRLWCHATVSRPDGTAGKRVDAEITLCDESGRLIASIEGCQLREVRRDALLQEPGGDLRNALYEVAWQIEPRGSVAARSEPDEPGAWIVFAESSTSVGANLIERLRGQNQRCIRVESGSQFGLLGRDHYEVDASAPADVRRLLEDALSREPAPCRGIVHLWSLDTKPMGDSVDAASQERAGASVLHLVQAVAGLEWRQTPRLWLVTKGAHPVEASSPNLAVEQAPLWGLGRIISLEHPELACVRVDMDPESDEANVDQFLEDLWSPDAEDQLAYRQGKRYVARLARSSVLGDGVALTSPAQDARPIQVRLSSYGQLDNLTIQPLTRRAPGPGEVEIQVRAAGLNFRDVLNALGLLQEHYARSLGITAASDITFGFECAGTIAAIGDGVSDLAVGDDVIAVASHAALASFITLRREFVVSKPAALTFEEAATLPLAFLTAYYGLHHLAKLQPGERVLIHAAAGGVGQACVQWARHVGAEVFATASPAKWEFLRTSGLQHIMNSRTLDFTEEVKNLTEEGVDVVINTLSGEFVTASFAALRPGGRFVELGKRDVWSADEVRQRRPDVSYFPFDLVEVARHEPEAIAGMLAEMTNCLRAGAFAPLPHTVFPVAKVTDAFRYMAEARHVGKIAVTMPLAGEEAPPSIREDGSYLITGGLGALGLEIAASLVEQGARHIVLSSRRPANDEARAAVERLQQAGAKVLVIQADVADPDEVERLLTKARETLPPLRGIVHAAGVLDDGVLLQQTWDRFRKVMAPKVAGAWNLHTMSQNQPLDFFVCFSSVASLVGNAGQGNYAAANAFMEALAHYRRARGLPGLSINWGPWADAGMAADGGGQRQRRLSDQGFRSIAADQGVAVFSELLRTHVAQVGVLPINWPQFLQVNPAGRRFFERVAKAPVKAAEKAPDIRRELATAADPRAVLTRHVRSVVAKVLGVRDSEGIDPRARLFDLGLESLMAVEMRGRFEESLGCSLRPTLLFDYPTIEALADHLAGKLPEPRATKPAPVGISEPEVLAPLDDELQDLNEDEIADRLAQELMATTKVQEQ
jgi:acyl transferase domain-containing protein/acyl carrier protein